jgi:hypothetical protein
MLATFIIEICLLCFVVARYSMKSTRTRIAAVMLFCLALFQLSEYNVCGRFNLDALTWSRIGFVMITLLPTLGIHLVHELAGIKRRWLVALSYLSAAVFIYLFVFSSMAFVSHQCAGNYAIFQLANHLGGSYFIYYYGWLAVALLVAGHAMQGAQKARRLALEYLIGGYLFFIIPTTLVNTVKPDTINGIPSVMCGFAIIFAIVLVFGILPIKLPKPKRTS